MTAEKNPVNIHAVHVCFAVIILRALPWYPEVQHARFWVCFIYVSHSGRWKLFSLSRTYLSNAHHMFYEWRIICVHNNIRFSHEVFFTEISGLNFEIWGDFESILKCGWNAWFLKKILNGMIKTIFQPGNHFWEKEISPISILRV